jgi:hypothetical protein
MNATNEEIVMAFATAKNANLTEWVLRHPSAASEMAQVATQNWAGEAPTSAGDIARVQSIGLDVLKTRMPLINLKTEAEKKGFTSESLAAALKLPRTVITKLQRRLIRPETLPQRLIEQIAEKLDRSTSDIASYFKMPPQLIANGAFRHDEAPVIEQETFADALLAEEMTMWEG